VSATPLASTGLLSDFRRLRRNVFPQGDDGPTKPIPVIRVILRSIQRSDLNLLAAYRKIPLLGAPPLSVTYTRANTRAVYRKTIDDIHTLLLIMQGPEAAEDRARLDRHGRMQISAELPLMYATGRHAEPPQVTFPVAEEAVSNKPPRARESQLEANSFLKSLPVWRYAK